MLSAITIDDQAGSPVSFHDGANRLVQRATGFATITTPRSSVRSRPTAHGAIDETHWMDARIYNIEGLVLGVSKAATIAELRAVHAPLLATLDSGPTLLKWTEEGSGLSLQAVVKLAGEVDTILAPGPNMLAYQAQLRAEDPRAYSQTLNTSTGSTIGTSSGGMTFNRTFNITFAASTGGTVAVNNLGNQPTPPVFRIYGGVTNPDITLVGTGKQISLTGTVQAGDYLEIDVFARTIKLNGTSNALYYLDAANTTWFELPVGTSTIQATAFAFDATARCDVLYRSAYS